MFGHSSRVWKVKELGNKHLVTSSEDTTIRVWSLESGEEIRVLQGMSPLAGKNVRGLDVYDLKIASGAEDSSIRLFNAFESKKLISSIRIPLPG